MWFITNCRAAANTKEKKRINHSNNYNETVYNIPVSYTHLDVYKRQDEAMIAAKDFHFPVKLSIKSSKPDELTMIIIGELIDQVYQFSRMYWKSISQQNLPVTTIYPEMVAKIFPHFDREELPEFAKKNLWFL